MPIKADIVIGPDGKVTVFTRGGTFNEGRKKLLALIEELKAQGLEITETGDVEQHRHDEQSVTVHALQKEGHR